MYLAGINLDYLSLRDDFDKRRSQSLAIHSQCLEYPTLVIVSLTFLFRNSDD